MNFELSITLIFIGLLALAGLSKIWTSKDELFKNRAVWLVSAFVGINGLSLFWTANFTRGFLTFGVVGCFWLIFLAAVVSKKTLGKLLPAMIKILIISSLIISLFAWLQAILDLAGVSEAITGMCAGCRSDLFGFPRFTAFAAEPQFFGSLLILPILILLRKIIKEKFSLQRAIIFTFLFTTMMMTMSRGAIYALFVGCLVLIILSFRSWKKWGIGVILMIFGLIISLGAQGLMAATNPRVEETFWGAATKSLHQLSLGIIDFRRENEEEITDESTTINATINSTINETEKPQFDGYVEVSTEQRLLMSRLAIKSWRRSPTTIIFGVGVGGSPATLWQQFPEEISGCEIINNEFLEILLEFGLVGTLIFGAMIVGLFQKTCSQKWLWSILAAFLIQWLFFSGYPNALHVYLILIVIYATASKEALLRKM